MALIHPKLQKRHANAPDTTNQASSPPSGNDRGSMAQGVFGFISDSCWCLLDVDAIRRVCFVDGFGGGQSVWGSMILLIADVC